MTKKIWSCKIGEIDDDALPPGCDLPMRKAVESAYKEVTGGQDPKFIFSGWGGELTKGERDVADCTCGTWPHRRECAVFVPEHEWEFYANGSFCKRCGTSIGSGLPCH